ncbi:signal peptide protein [Rhodopirellula maiorica SM1]|uniref:Signal peptide protein n=1 Tax=Rhodopirellula maiorica SM1 TaxID=1265738 RepID=M5REA0_9BACT|nr:signal peptide protein [Rhodopirellula maiorica SM1]
MVALLLGWQLRSIEHLATGQQQRSFVVDCDFDKFRQIMVRKNATAAIVEHTGMRLIGERIEGVVMDTSQDDRPLLNAIRGVTKTEVSAVKELMVQLENPMLEASELVLTQNADIHPDHIDVTTVSKGPAGRLKHYQTTLDAKPDPEGTRVALTVALDVLVNVPSLFKYRADAGVQQAADDAINGQAAAIEAFIGKHAGESFILPELMR